MAPRPDHAGTQLPQPVQGTRPRERPRQWRGRRAACLITLIEREVKLGAGPAFHLPDLAGVIEGVAVAPPETVRMETVYYDTADLRLARWGVSLRRRAGEGWTLKLAQPPSTPVKPGAVRDRAARSFGSTAAPGRAGQGRDPKRHRGVGRRTPSSRPAGQDRPRSRGDTSGARGDAQAAVQPAHVWPAAGPGVDRAPALGAGVACDGPWRGARSRGSAGTAARAGEITAGGGPAFGGVAASAPPGRDRRAAEEAARGPPLTAVHRPGRAVGCRRPLAAGAAGRRPAGGWRAAGAGHDAVAPLALGRSWAAGDADGP